MKKMRKGFTLVELLIVIAILGTLAAMMTLSSSGATASATASRIASGFKIVRVAASMYAADSGDKSTAIYFSKHSTDYVGPESAKLIKAFTITSSDGPGTKDWYASYTITGDTAAIGAKFKKYSEDLSMTGTATEPKMKIY